ncbi:MAG: hypothetical protein ABIH23_10625 [bacterium]
MPILTYGEFTAGVTGHDLSCVESKTARFKYYPLGPMVWLIFVVVAVRFIRKERRKAKARLATK